MVKEAEPGKHTEKRIQRKKKRERILGGGEFRKKIRKLFIASSATDWSR